MRGLKGRTVEISFCQTCGNRLKHARLTLPRNLMVADKWPVEFILLDYGSSDGLADWVRALGNSMVRYFRYEHQGGFECSHAKNLAHRLGRGRVLCNLDIDNLLHALTLPRLLRLGNREIAHLYSGRNIIRGIGPSRHEMADGTYGRIAMTASTFCELRGYDEQLREMGYQDTDLLERATRAGMSVTRDGNPFATAIDHPKENDWPAMYYRNRDRSRSAKRGPVNASGYGRGTVTALSGKRIELS